MTHRRYEDWGEPLLQDRSVDREIYLLADFQLQTSLALACCHANETKINIPWSAKPCVNNHTANNLNTIPSPYAQITVTVFVRRQCKINRKRRK